MVACFVRTRFRLNRSFPWGVVYLLFFAHSALQAEWALESSQRLSANDAPVIFVQKTVLEGVPVELRLVLFNSRKCALQVVDNPSGVSLAEAMDQCGGLAGVNGNYFRADHTPIGLVIENGRVLHPLEHAKLLSGLLVVGHGRVSLLRISEYQSDAKVMQALQAGPFLVDHGVPVSGLNDSKRAERTAVLSDGDGHAALLVCCSPVTLADMARILCSKGCISEFRVKRALNLDGGSSTALWVKEPAYYRREFKQVANFLCVMPLVKSK